MTTSTNTSDSGRRIPELDGIRGCAIFLVLIWHYVQNQIVAETGSPLAYFKQALWFTWSGVDLFFVLSGFLIAGILLDKRDTPHYFRTFYIRRICRIFPLYYLNLGLFLLAIGLGLASTSPFQSLFSGSDVPFWSYLTFTQNILMAANNSAGPNWLAVTWSLAVEEQFYLFFPLLVRFVPASRLPLFFLWFICTAVFMRVAYPGLSAYINTLWRADSLMIGALLAYLVRSPWFLELAHRSRLLIAAAFIGLSGMTGFISLYGGLALGGAFTHLLLAVTYGLLILLALLFRDGPAGILLRSRMLVWLGSISYGVYILHTGICQLIHALLRNAPPTLSSWPGAATTLLALATTLFIAHISFHLFERRFIQFGHGMSYGR